VIVAQGGTFGGWSLYVKDGRPTYAYNPLGVQHSDIVTRGAAALMARLVRIPLDVNTWEA
jgi:hypothetical protein